jgi:hypothetical protein
MKQEASGWPEWCQSENDRWSYIRDYHEKEGILLDYNNIKKNPGLRSNMPRIKYISEPVEYFDMLTSDQILGIVLRSTGDKLYYSVVGHFIGEIS